MGRPTVFLMRRAANRDRRQRKEMLPVIKGTRARKKEP